MTDLRTRAERLIVTTEAAGLLPTAATIRDLLSEWDKATSQRDSLLAQFVGLDWDHEITITVEEPPSLDSLQWPSTDSHSCEGDCCLEDVKEMPTQLVEAFELPHIPEAEREQLRATACAPDTAF